MNVGEDKGVDVDTCAWNYLKKFTDGRRKTEKAMITSTGEAKLRADQLAVFSLLHGAAYHSHDFSTPGTANGCELLIHRSYLSSLRNLNLSRLMICGTWRRRGTLNNIVGVELASHSGGSSRWYIIANFGT